tara:strand:- start:18 stop:518 length:501 start_codon:yes stop_codon:yes gene_type:complete
MVKVYLKAVKNYIPLIWHYITTLIGKVWMSSIISFFTFSIIYVILENVLYLFFYKEPFKIYNLLQTLTPIGDLIDLAFDKPIGTLIFFLLFGISWDLISKHWNWGKVEKEDSNYLKPNLTPESAKRDLKRIYSIHPDKRTNIDEDLVEIYEEIILEEIRDKAKPMK